MHLGKLLQAQLELQQEHMKDGDPRLLQGEERLEFIRWNVLACTDELHEALQETGWKPWADSDHVNEAAFLAELVDAFHFFMNLILVAFSDYDLAIDPEDMADDFVAEYFKKKQVNAERQETGYTGLDKCPGCARDLKSQAVAMNMVPWEFEGKLWCSKGCAMHHHPESFDQKGQLVERV